MADSLAVKMEIQMVALLVGLKAGTVAVWLAGQWVVMTERLLVDGLVEQTVVLTAASMVEMWDLAMAENLVDM